MLLIYLVTAIICLAEPLVVEHNISTRTTIEGETLGAQMVITHKELFLIYSNADATVTAFDSKGEKKHTLLLESIGRGSYLGDSFTAFDDTLVFLNTVDMRLEYFDYSSGKWIQATPIPANLFTAPKEIDNFPVGITYENDQIFILSRKEKVSITYPHIRRIISPGSYTSDLVRVTQDSLFIGGTK